MQEIIVVHINRKNKENCERENNCPHEHERLGRLLLEEIENDLKQIEHERNEIAIKHAIASHIRESLLESFGLDKKFEKEKEKKEEKANTKEPIKYEETTEKIDGSEDESLSEPMLERLKVLEQVVNDVAEKLGKAEMTGRFKQIGELHQKLQKCLNCPDEKKETMEHLVEVEATIGDALDFLATSKLTARFKLLKQLRQELGEALTSSRKK